MKNLMVSFILIMLGMISGCANQKTIDDNQMADYCENLMRNSAFDPIRKKINLIDNIEPTPQMLANTNKPTAEEKKSIAFLIQQLPLCHEKQIAFTRKYKGNFYAENQAHMYQQDLAILKSLYYGNLSYGEFSYKNSINYADYERQNSNIRLNQISQPKTATILVTP